MAVSRTVIRVEDPLAWLNGLTPPQVALELTVIAGCVLSAWLLVWLVRRATVRFELSILLGRRLIDGVLFPLVLMGLSFAARTVLAHQSEAVLLDIWVPVCVSLACIRLGVKVLQVTFRQAIGCAPSNAPCHGWPGAVQCCGSPVSCPCCWTSWIKFTGRSATRCCRCALCLRAV